MEDRRLKLDFIKIIVFAGIAIIVFSCENTRSTPELEQHFSKNQIKDLNELNDFFISEYLKSSRDNYGDSFKKMFVLEYNNGIDTLINQIDFNEQLKLYNSISKSTFDEIWEIKTNTTEMFYGEKYILPKFKGKFQSYLKGLSRTNSLAKDCWKYMEQSGDFFQLMLNIYISKNIDEINFTDFNNQLIISIYYLSMIDNFGRDEKSKKRRLELQNKVQKQFKNL